MDLNVYWFSKVKNFGDLLNKDLFEYYGFKPKRTLIKDNPVLAVGSVLGMADKEFSGAILGSGMIAPYRKRFPKAEFYGVRGALTRELLKLNRNITLGDPGLLASRLVPQTGMKSAVLGLVPHYVHKDHPAVGLLAKRYPSDVKVIDVQQDPKQVFDEISQCNFILSSSLHGLIVAESYGVPNAWMYLGDELKGGRYKFDDYASIHGAYYQPNSIDGTESLSELVAMTREVPLRVSEVQDELDMMFRLFAARNSK